MSARFLHLSDAMAAIALIALCGCQKKDASRYTRNGLFIVRMQTPTNTSEAQIADSLGFWQEEGLEPEYVGILNPATLIPAALSGKIDVIGGHPNTFSKARLAGAKITIVVNGLVDAKDFPHIAYHVTRKSGIAGIEGFRELAQRRKIKVGVISRNGCADWYLDEWLLAGGVREEQIDWEIMPQKQQLEALSKGLIDVATTHTPFIKPTDADPAFRRILSSYDIVKDPAAGGAYNGFTDKFLAKYPDKVAAFVRVYERVHEWSNAHPDSSKRLLARIFKLPVEKVDYRYFAARRWIDDSDMIPWFKRQYAHRDFRPGTKIIPSDIYTNAYNDYWKKAGKPNTVVPFQTPKLAGGSRDAFASLASR